MTIRHHKRLITSSTGKFNLRGVSHEFLNKVDEYRDTANILDIDPHRWSHWDLDVYDFRTYYFYYHHEDYDQALISSEMESIEPYIREIEYDESKEDEYELVCTIMFMLNFDLVTKFMITERSLLIKRNIDEAYDIILDITIGMFSRFIKKGKPVGGGRFSGLLTSTYGPLYSDYVKHRDKGLPPVPDADDVLYDLQLEEVVYRSEGNVPKLEDNPESAILDFSDLYNHVGELAIDETMKSSPWKYGSKIYELIRQSLVLSLYFNKVITYGLSKEWTDTIKHLIRSTNYKVLDAFHTMINENKELLSHPYNYEEELFSLNRGIETSVKSYIRYRNR